MLCGQDDDTLLFFCFMFCFSYFYNYLFLPISIPILHIIERERNMKGEKTKKKKKFNFDKVIRFDQLFFLPVQLCLSISDFCHPHLIIMSSGPVILSFPISQFDLNLDFNLNFTERAEFPFPALLCSGLRLGTVHTVLNCYSPMYVNVQECMKNDILTIKHTVHQNLTVEIRPWERGMDLLARIAYLPYLQVRSDLDGLVGGWDLISQLIDRIASLPFTNLHEQKEDGAF